LQLRSKPTVISLFTGAGGLDLGFEQAGYEIRVCVENDPVTCKTLRRNRPHWKIIEKDIRFVTTEEILEAAGLRAGEPTVVTGGPPCQPFSTLGKRKALEDPRGALLREFIRVVNEARPRVFLFENVPGLCSVNRGRILKELLEAFNDIGYNVNYDILNAADYGVPQVRKRLFILGSREGIKLEFPPKDHSKDGSGGLKKWVTVDEAFRKMVKEGWDFNRPDNKRMRHSREMIERMSLIKPGENFLSLPLEKRPPCWRNGRHQGKDTFGRIDPNAPAPTIRTCAYNPTKGRYIHPYENRGLSTLEMAVLQTFPKDYIFEGSLVKIGKQIGDAVPVLLARKIAEYILFQLNGGRRQLTLESVMKQA